MQTIPYYCNIIISTGKKVHYQSYSTVLKAIDSPFCDFQTPMQVWLIAENSPNFESTWDFLFKFGFFAEFTWNFSTNLIDSPGFVIYSLVTG